MSLTKYPPNIINIHGELDHIENSQVASTTIVPGMIVETSAVSGVPKWRPHSDPTRQITAAVALSQVMENKGVDFPYSTGDLVQVWYLEPGDIFWASVPSGQTVTAGDFLQSNGDGWLKAATAVTATSNLARFKSMETL